MSNRFGLAHVDHVTLVVSDLDATRRFYCDALGMFEVPRPTFDFPGLWLHTQPPKSGEMVRALIHATLANKQSGQAGWGDRGGTRVTRGHHIAFEVQDVVALYEFLQGKDIEIVSGPQHRPDGPTQIFVKDPDGHLIEFFSGSSI